MRINYMMFGAGVAVLLIGIVLNAKHYNRLSEELAETLRREAMPSSWAGILSATLIALLLLAQSWQWILVILVALFLEGIYFVKKQHIQLNELRFPQLWLKQKRWVDFVFLIAGFLVISAIVYPKYQVFKYHW